MADSLTMDPPVPGLMEGVTQALNQDAVEAASRGEPEWLRRRRLEAWAAYERTPMPTTALEQWRYTDLSEKLDLESLSLLPWEARSFSPEKAPDLLREAMEQDWDASGHLVDLEGAVAHADLLDELAAKGVVLTSLRSAVESHPELLEELLATRALPAGLGKFQALNAALWTDGVLLYVPRGVRLEMPVRVTRWTSEEGKALFSRTLIVADAASQVSFVDESLSRDFAKQTFVSSAVEVFAREGAQVQAGEASVAAETVHLGIPAAVARDREEVLAGHLEPCVARSRHEVLRHVKSERHTLEPQEGAVLDERAVE
jgi:Fe-S cluster assembly protein SufD